MIMKYNCYSVYKEDDSSKLLEIEKKIDLFSLGYSIKKWRIPALIHGDILEKCGYFTTLPHQITSAAIFKNVSDGMSRCKLEENTCCSEYYLTPAACIHVYPMLQQAAVYNELITVNARVYRYEGGEHQIGTRLWDFEVKEYVAVGTSEFVEAFLNDYKHKAINLASQYGLNAEIKKASDHFYPSKDNIMKKRFQLANNLKFELVVPRNEKELSLCSFNYHGSHFSEAFHFDKQKKIVTGCVGFGLDRWLSSINSITGEH